MPETLDAPDTGTDTPTEPTDTVEPGQQAEVEKWKATSRKHEERAKANAAAAKELEELKRSMMSDQEKAVAEARETARAETLREVAAERVDSKIEAAFVGRDVDVEALLEGLDRSKFLTAEGEPDTVAIAAWRDRIAPEREEPTPPKPDGFPDLGQGNRNSLGLGSDPLLAALKGALDIQ
jgi:signal recognition particle GTPase